MKSSMNSVLFVLLLCLGLSLPVGGDYRPPETLEFHFGKSDSISITGDWTVRNVNYCCHKDSEKVANMILNHHIQ